MSHFQGWQVFTFYMFGDRLRVINHMQQENKYVIHILYIIDVCFGESMKRRGDATPQYAVPNPGNQAMQKQEEREMARWNNRN